MAVLAKAWKGLRVALTAKPQSEPEPAYGKARPMKGLALSAEKREKASVYKGSINHGDPALAKR